MTKRWFWTAFPAMGISLIILIIGRISAGDPVPGEPARTAKTPARMLEPALKMDLVHSIELGNGPKNKPILIDRPAADRYGNLHMLVNDAATPRGTGYSIQKFAPDGTLVKTIPLTHEPWNPPVEAFDLAVGKEGTLYVAVNWPIRRGGLIAVDDSGHLLFKVTFEDFVPHQLDVDDCGHVWALGQGIDPIKAELERSYIPVNPKEGEQLRVYGPDLEYLATLVRGEREGLFPSTLRSSGKEVVYYASGTETIRVFRHDRLVRKLALPKLMPLAPPAEVSRGGFETVRFLTGVYKIGDRFLVTGSYLYRTHSGGVPTGISRRFIALLSADGEAASPEFEPPENVAIQSYANGHFIAFSGSRAKGMTVMMLKPVIE